MIYLLGAIVLVAATVAGSSDKVENYPDGAKHLVYSVGSDGTKNGPFKELFPDGKTAVQASYRNDQLDGVYRSFFPNGKVKISTAYRKGQLDGKHLEFSDAGVMLRSAGYRAGMLNGPNQEFVKGQLTKSEFWIDGKLILPKSADQIATEVAAINRSQIKWVGKFPEVVPDVDASLKNPAINLQREAALRALMSYRCICGLPYDLELDRDQTAHAQAAARILSHINKMTHTPDNPGWPEDEYKFAYKGTSSSNIHMMSPSGESLLNGMKDWIGDSDAANIAKLGHRRWCLNPAMQTTGFGIEGNYTAMWSFDSSRAEIPDYDYVAFPPHGLTAIECFHDKDAWCVSLNSKKFSPPDAKEVKVSVWPARFMPRQVALEKASQPLEIENFEVSLEGFGIRDCIIFRPVGVAIKSDAAYSVEISGLKGTGGKPTTIEYVVAFFSLSQTRPSHR